MLLRTKSEIPKDFLVFVTAQKKQLESVKPETEGAVAQLVRAPVS